MAIVRRTDPIHGLILLLVLIGPLWSCAAEPGGDGLHALHGPWTWVGSTGGIAGVHATPETEGHDVTFFFYRGGTIAIYRDATLYEQTSYSFTEPPDTIDTESDEIVEYADPLTIFIFSPRMQSHSLRRIAPDTIILADPCCDRYEHTFVRHR